MKVCTWCIDPNGIENNNILKYTYHVGIQKCDILIYRYLNAIQKNDTNLTLVQTAKRV